MTDLTDPTQDDEIEALAAAHLRADPALGMREALHKARNEVHVRRMRAAADDLRARQAGGSVLAKVLPAGEPLGLSAGAPAGVGR